MLVAYVTGHSSFYSCSSVTWLLVVLAGRRICIYLDMCGPAASCVLPNTDTWQPCVLSTLLKKRSPPPWPPLTAPKRCTMGGLCVTGWGPIYVCYLGQRGTISLIPSSCLTCTSPLSPFHSLLVLQLLKKSPRKSFNLRGWYRMQLLLPSLPLWRH